MPRQWPQLVNTPQTEAELELELELELDAVRRAMKRGSPFGNEDWSVKTAERLSIPSPAQYEAE